MALRAIPESWPDFAANTAMWARGYAPVVLVFVGVYIAVVNKVTAYINPPETWAAIHGFLNNARDYFFKGMEDPLHHHRVTLFKWRTWTWREWSIRDSRWPWSGWLIPVARSGHTTQRSNTCFRASASDPESAEGFAGQVWAKNRTIVLNHLPDLKDDSGNEAVRLYAEVSSVSEDWLRQRLKEGKPCARSFCGMPVEVNNKLWGVIVLDSQNEEQPESSDLQEVYGLLGRLLGNMLQGN